MFRFIDSFTSNNNGLQLDIVGFLAILGEGAIETIAQVSTLSYFSYLPRLLPAPQVFIKPQRPDKLDSIAEAEVIGIHSGNAGARIHYIAHALHRGDKLHSNTVTCVRVTENDKDRPSIRRFGPLVLLALFGFLMSAMLVALSVYYEDGMSFLATMMLSLLSTNIGIANKWRPSPNDPKPDKNSPQGDVVIKYPQGAFIVVQCEERTARYLYFNTSERCIYAIASTSIYRFLSLISTLLLMGGVICLANARIQTQTAWAGAFFALNIASWACAALPPARHWDLSRLKIEKIELRGGLPPKRATIDNVPPTYTEALWKAIAVTGTKNWVKEAGWAPRTPAWDEWLHEAEQAAECEPIKIGREQGKEIWTIRSWDFKAALSMKLEHSTALLDRKV